MYTNTYNFLPFWALMMAQMVKSLPAMQKTRVRSLGWEDPLEKGWQPTPVFLPGESHGQRSLVGYSPWGFKEPDMTRQLSTHTHTTNKSHNQNMHLECQQISKKKTYNPIKNGKWMKTEISSKEDFHRDIDSTSSRKCKLKAQIVATKQNQ